MERLFVPELECTETHTDPPTSDLNWLDVIKDKEQNWESMPGSTYQDISNTLSGVINVLHFSPSWFLSTSSPSIHPKCLKWSQLST